MANASWSTNTRDDIGTDLGYGLGLGRMCRVLEQFCHPQNSKYLLETTDENAAAYLQDWRITAFTPGLDSDVNGWVYYSYVDNVPAGGSFTLRAWNDSARTVKVAEGTGLDAATITLVPEAGYTLAGTVDAIAAAASFTFRAQIWEPPVKAVERLFDGAAQDDGQIKDELFRRVSAARARFAEARAEFQAGTKFIMDTKVARLLVGTTGAELLNPRQRDTSGTITQNPTGRLEDFRSACELNDSGGAAPIKAGAATLSGAVAYTASVWAGTATSPTYGQRGVAGVWTFVFETTLAGVPPKARARFMPTDSRRAPKDGKEPIFVGTLLTIGKSWLSPENGIDGLTIDYLATSANSSGTPLSATAADFSVVGLTTSNSDNGKLWVYHTGTVIQFYRSEQGRDAQDPDELVDQKTTSATATSLTSEGLTAGLTITFKTGATAASGNKGSIDFNIPAVGDYFTITVSEVAGSLWVQTMRDGGVGGVNYEPHTAGSPNLLDGWIQRCLPLINPAVFGQAA